ncbi:carbohydrate ABC transporter permease [Jatrophihabitans lederbergiae]|uniref:Carbohydrate ABC transporter permease n=1 Tax=Jatrophihabitans lederbergiae TaxID=3075547 RepID=A0ABU2JG88_9ACTN|nr:carbohydrate ABC transporter permease [Jatrophihabitans sp. DSM 44399]MDT0263743.1 carbohydrate ABC transporter permease [Jatrophihabitans sp. DSM 44399]
MTAVKPAADGSSTSNAATPDTGGTRTGRPRRLGRPMLYLCMLIVGVTTLFPLYWLVISSLKTPSESSAIPITWWPHHINWSAYKTVFQVVPFGRSFLNSLFVTVICSLSVTATSLLSAFVFAKYRFRGRDGLFWLLVLTMFLPPIVTIVPLYNMMSSLHLNDSYLGLMLPWLANAFGIFLMRQFISDIPDELIEAARIDGAGELRIVVQIVTPLLKPPLVTLLVFTTVYYWNNFLWPLTILQSQEKFPITVTLAQLLSYNTTVQYQSVVMAGVLIASLPTLLVFLLAQRVFVAGIARSGVK